MTGTISISGHDVYVLVDSGATHSFVSENFATNRDLKLHALEGSLIVSIPSGDALVAEKIVLGARVRIEDQEFLANLVVLGIGDFDVLLGMDWLSTYRATMDCYKKEFRLGKSGELEVVFRGVQKSLATNMMTAMTAAKMLHRGYPGYLAYVIDHMMDEVRLEDIPVVREFSDVFLEDLPGLPLEREIEFEISLIPGTEPIARTPYRMAPA